MPTQLLLDGDDLPELMLRVRNELGPDAVVVKAERVRTGGVAGFFAKEHFEVTVEVPDPPVPGTRRARRLAEAGAAGAATGMQALLDAADASDVGQPAAQPAADLAAHAAAGRVAPPVSGEGETFATLLASMSEMSGTLPAQRRPDEPTSSTGAPTTAMPARSAAAPSPTEASPDVSPARAVAPGTPDAAAPDPATPRFARFADKGASVTAASFGPLASEAPTGESPAVVTPDVAPGAPDLMARPAPAPTPAPPSPAASPALATAAAPAASTATQARAGVQPATFARVAPGTVTTRDGGETRAAGTAPASEHAQARMTGTVDPTPAAELVPAVGTAAPSASDLIPASAAAPAADAAATPATAPDDADARRALIDVGIPAFLVDDLGAPASLGGAVARFARPPALLRAPGSLVAVIGEGGDVVVAAREIARRAGLDPRDVALAGDLQPTDATDREVLTVTTAPRQRSRTSTLGAVTVVAVAVGPDRADRAAAAALVQQLDPDQCWAVVDARRKSADLRAWMAEVAGGRRLAGVAGTRVDETCEPGTLLDLAVPVGWLDGLPATPVVWAAVLGEHLHQDPPRR